MGLTLRAKGGLSLAIFPPAEVSISPYKPTMMKLGGGWVVWGLAPRRICLVVSYAHSNMLNNMATLKITDLVQKALWFDGWVWQVGLGKFRGISHAWKNTCNVNCSSPASCQAVTKGKTIWQNSFG